MGRVAKWAVPRATPCSATIVRTSLPAAVGSALALQGLVFGEYFLITLGVSLGDMGDSFATPLGPYFSLDLSGIPFSFSFSALFYLSIISNFSFSSSSSNVGLWDMVPGRLVLAGGSLSGSA